MPGIKLQASEVCTKLSFWERLLRVLAGKVPLYAGYFSKVPFLPWHAVSRDTQELHPGGKALVHISLKCHQSHALPHRAFLNLPASVASQTSKPLVVYPPADAPLLAAPAPGPSHTPPLGTGKLEVVAGSNADVIGLDWSTNMAVARQTLGSHKVQGNVDPMILFGTQQAIEAEVHRVLAEAGPQGHILNVGHGVVQGTPEESVGYFCELARQSGTFFAKQQQQQPAEAATQQAAAQQLVGSAV